MVLDTLLDNSAHGGAALCDYYKTAPDMKSGQVFSTLTVSITQVAG